MREGEGERERGRGRKGEGEVEGEGVCEKGREISKRLIMLVVILY